MAARKKKVAEPEPEKVLVLRSCRADGSSHGGFKYPLTVGSVVECPDWNPAPERVGGLHGLLWGQGDYSLICWDDDAWFQVFECLKADVVEIGNKCKFRVGTQVFIGQRLAPGFALAQAYLVVNDKRKHPGTSSKAASSGYYSKAASSGDSSAAASSGNYSAATSSGNYSAAASSGNYSAAASSGNYSTAASSGYASRAEATGKNTVAMVAGVAGRAKCGVGGGIALAWLDEKAGRVRVIAGNEGDDIKADTWYEVVGGKLSVVKP